MNPLFTSTFAGKFLTAFSWMLIHSLWQGLLLAIIAGAVLMLNKKWGAVYRYNLALVLFVGFAGVCSFTFIIEWFNDAAQIIVPPIPGTIGAKVSALFPHNVNNIRRFTATFAKYFTQNSPLIVTVWFMFFLFKCVKMISCMVYNQQIRTRQVYTPDQFWADAVDNLTKKLKVNKVVQLFQSGYIKMPVVVGHLKPIILIPMGLMASLPAEQMEAILLHELAHIRRNDYFVNFLQNIAETVFFFNPGLLWLSSLLREERENCCDDIALQQTNNKKGFVEALISFKEYELYGSNYATTFPGKKNYLLRRVSRILSNNNKTFGLGEKIFLSVSLIMLSAVVTTATVSQIKGTADAKIHRVAISHASRAKTAISEVNSKNSKAVVSRIAIAKREQIMDNGIYNIISTKAAVTTTTKLVTTEAETTPVKNNNEVIAVKEQEERDRQQAIKDQEQAKKDQAQALIDQQQALKDRVQAWRDRAEAVKNRVQAEQDRKQADDERVRQNQSQATKNQEQARRNKEQERLNEIQAQKNEEQVAHNQEQARLNQLQDVKNQQQARLNQIQAQKNQQLSIKNAVSVQQ